MSCFDQLPRPVLNLVTDFQKYFFKKVILIIFQEILKSHLLKNPLQPFFTIGKKNLLDV